MYRQSFSIAGTFTAVSSNLALFTPLSLASVSPLERLRFPRPDREKMQTHDIIIPDLHRPEGSSVVAQQSKLVLVSL